MSDMEYDLEPFSRYIELMEYDAESGCYSETWSFREALMKADKYYKFALESRAHLCGMPTVDYSAEQQATILRGKAIIKEERNNFETLLENIKEGRGGWYHDPNRDMIGYKPLTLQLATNTTPPQKETI